MEAREAAAADGPALAAFRCALTDAVYEVEVENFIHDSLEWLASGPDRHLVLFEDGDELVAVFAYEPLLPEWRGFFVPFGAVALSRQGSGLGAYLFENLLYSFAQKRSGGVAIWRVHRENERSQRMCEKLGFGDQHRTLDPDDRTYYTYVARLARSSA